MRKSIARELATNIVIFMLVIVLCIGYLLFSVYHVSPGKNYTSVTMQLDNTYLIVPGTGVSMNGVKIGEVTSVTPNTHGALVHMKYGSEYDVPKDSKIQIGQQSAIGEPYVDFVPQSDGGETLRNGSVVDAKKVAQPQSIPRIFGLLQQLTSTFSADPMAKIVNNMYEAFKDTDASMVQLQNGAQMLTSVIGSRQDELKTLFANTQFYMSDMQWMADDIGPLGVGVGGIINSFVPSLKGLSTLVYQGQLHHNLVDIIDPFLTKLNDKLVPLWPNLVDALTPFVPIAAAINQVLPQIDISAMISTALSTFGSDGAANLTVTIPAPKQFPPNITTTTRAPAR